MFMVTALKSIVTALKSIVTALKLHSVQTQMQQ